jgi:hypothetical protein
MVPLVTLATLSWPSVRRYCGRERLPGGPVASARDVRYSSLCRRRSAAVHGRLPEWPKGTVCKTVGSAYVGSNPTPATLFPQVKAGVTGWWHRLLRAVASGLWTVGEGLWASCGPDSDSGPLFDSCSIYCSEQQKILFSTVVFRDASAWYRPGSAGRRWAGREIHGRMADGLGARHAVGVAAGFPGVYRWLSTDGHGPGAAGGPRTRLICWLRRSSRPWMQWL